MPGHPRRSVTRMTLPEAERIVALAHDGALDRSDESVERIVREAHVVVQRSSMWGSAPGNPARKRTVVVFLLSGALLGVWIVGLLAPLIMAGE
ncbi:MULTISPECIES: hypothetical protein [unclassified Frondihabitans]|uniref:hypothetical protein n=1 Tax=unclassified Frondihabitans TaxID=2626248 RepID=UPI000F50F4CB|nr:MULTISPECIES: hypothetical protein [unclassified Frondihabitans]